MVDLSHRMSILDNRTAQCRAFETLETNMKTLSLHSHSSWCLSLSNDSEGFSFGIEGC